MGKIKNTIRRTKMRKIATIMLVGLMIIGMMGCVQAIAQDGNDLEELVGLKIKVWYAAGIFNHLTCTGILSEIKGNWLIMIGLGWFDKGEYTWCYIPTIRGIDVLNENYEPRRIK